VRVSNWVGAKNAGFTHKTHKIMLAPSTCKMHKAHMHAQGTSSAIL